MLLFVVGKVYIKMFTSRNKYKWAFYFLIEWGRNNLRFNQHWIWPELGHFRPLRRTQEIGGHSESILVIAILKMIADATESGN